MSSYVSDTDSYAGRSACPFRRQRTNSCVASERGCLTNLEPEAPTAPTRSPRNPQTSQKKKLRETKRKSEKGRPKKP